MLLAFELARPWEGKGDSHLLSRTSIAWVTASRSASRSPPSRSAYQARNNKIEEIKTEALREVVEMDLRELRQSLGKTQVEMAEATGLTQPELSRMEHRLDYRLSTLRRYVEALGGHLEVTAVVGDKRVNIRTLEG
jgi:hypothetical protein